MPRVTEVLDAFSQVTQRSFDVERIGLRYINRLEIPSVGLDTYFDVHPLRFGTLPLTHINFLCRSEMAIMDNHNQSLVGTFATGPTGVDPISAGSWGETKSTQTRSFILDLDAIEQNLQDVSDTQSVSRVISALRHIERSAFEAAITEEARSDIFGGYETVPDE